MKQKKWMPYLVTAGIILGIFVVLFCVKGIYPFGENSLIWGDMHDQLTAFYYHLYDTFYGDSSIFINFSTSGGINFFGIFAYYLLSPLSFLILLFPREHIYQAISIIIVLKIVLSGLSCLYCIRTYFKKLPHYISVLLAICYAFCGYNILFYQINGWIDVVYLFPLLLIGLKKLLDGEKPVWYFIVLSISLIVCFYVSLLLLFFIFISSLLYLVCFYKKDTAKIKKGLVNLGIGTVLALAVSMIVILPTYQEISVSSRMGFDIVSLLTSEFGPLADKTVFFLTSGFSILGSIFFLHRTYHDKKKKHIFWFFAILFFLLFLPVIVEPINKMWHLGSYAFFPMRTGFVLQLLLILATAYYFDHYAKEIPPEKTRRYLSIFLALLGITTIVVTIVLNYSYFQKKIYGISLGSNWLVAVYLVALVFVVMGVLAVIFNWQKRNYNRFTFFLTWAVVLTNIITSCFLYFGIDYAQKTLTGIYQDMQSLATSYQDGDYMRIKDIYPKMVMNHGMVTGYHTLDHFTSLTDRNNIETLRKLGYSSYWVKTYSNGGSYFSDAVLANQYLISNQPYSNEQYLYLNQYGSIYFYRLKQDLSYGYFIQSDMDFGDETNAFINQNKLYQGLTGDSEPLFTFPKNPWVLNNITEKYLEKYQLTRYQLDDEDIISSFTRSFYVDGKKELYLEVLKTIDNMENRSILESMNVYVNGQLLQDKFPKEIDNGLLDLGTFENEEVTVTLELIKDVDLDILEIGMMDFQKYDAFLQNKKTDLTIDYTKNQIKVKVTSDKEQILFLPITYNEGYTLKVDGKDTEILQLYDNYLGVSLTSGEHELEFTFIPKGFKLGALASIAGLILAALIFLTPLYDKIIAWSWLGKMVLWIYLILYLFLMVFMYVLPFLGFVLSFIL